MIERFTKKATALAAACALLALCGCGSRPRDSAPKGKAVGSSAAAAEPGEVGSRLPTFAVKDVTGREVSSDDLRGKVVLIDFWATWCGPCKKEMPGFQELQDRYGKQGLVVIGIAMDTNSAGVIEFAKTLGVRYPLLLNSSELQQKLGEILGLPTTFVFDRQGTLHKKVIGFEYKEAYESLIEELL